MTPIRVSVDLSGVLDALDAQVQAMFPTIAQAVAMTVEHGAQEWKKSVWQAKLWVN